jgi:hypothetical protein
MKIIFAINSGLNRSLSAWKGVSIFWFISLMMVSFLIIPLKASLNAVFGNSMVIEKLVNGINVDVLGDMGQNLHSIIASLFSGILILSLACILVNIFISGGLFDALKKGAGRFTTENFFRTSAKNFWPFLIISGIMYLITTFLILIIIVLPASVAANAESAPEGIVFLVLAISCSIFLIIISLIFLVADYARAWQVSQPQNSCFRALGFGFRQTYRAFFSSFGLMFIMLIFQALVGLVVIKLIAGFTPVTGGGVFLLFIISQMLFLLKIYLKALRYASITSLMEQNSNNGRLITGDPAQSDPDNTGSFI